MLGVIVQANHGQKQDLRIGNVPIGELLIREEQKARAEMEKSSKAAETQKTLPVGGKAAEGSTSNLPSSPSSRLSNSANEAQASWS